MSKYWSDCSQSVSGATRAQTLSVASFKKNHFWPNLRLSPSFTSPAGSGFSWALACCAAPSEWAPESPWSFLEALPGWHPGRYVSSPVLAPPPSHMSSDPTRLPHWRLSVGLLCWQADTGSSTTLRAHTEQKPWNRMNKRRLWRSSPCQSHDVTYKKFSIQGK